MKKTQLVMVIDADKCIDCKACMAACKVANRVPDDKWRNWIKEGDMEEAARSRIPLRFQPGNCMHCDRPYCVDACPTGATYKNPLDGTVLINHKLCIGCGQCLPACPYGARFRNPLLKMADKCDFCAERRSVGLEPACVVTCPTKTRTFGDRNDPESDVYQLLRKNRVVQVVNAQTNTLPNIYYLGDPGPEDWPVQARMPDAYNFWKHLVGPVVNAVVLLSGVGAAAMLLKQLVMPNDPPMDQHEEDKGHE